MTWLSKINVITCAPLSVAVQYNWLLKAFPHRSLLHTSSIFRLKSTIKLSVSSLTLLRLLSLCLTRHFSTSYINWSSHQICFSAYPIICQTEPLLFLLYVNDIPNIQFSKDSRLIVYTDDLLLLKPISCQKDLLTFQCDVNLISQWTLQNQLSLNCNKTKYTFISSCNNFNFPIHVNSNQIERFIAPNTMGSRFVMTLLGLSILRVSVMDRRRLLGYIFRRFSPHCSPDSILHVYKTLGVTHSGVCMLV